MPKKSIKSADLSLSDLEKMYNQKKEELLESLKKERDELNAKLDSIEDKISDITGERSYGRTSRRMTGKRLKNKKTLHQTISEILKGNKDGMSVREIVEAVESSDYKSNSKDMRNTIYQCIYHSDDMKVNSKTKRWTLS